MRALMNDASQSIARAHAGSLKRDDPLALLLAGHRATLAKNAKDAETAFSRALEKAPPNWDHRVEALLGLLKAKEHTGATCDEEAERVLERNDLGHTSLAADYASEAMDCVDQDTDARSKRIRE